MSINTKLSSVTTGVLSISGLNAPNEIYSQPTCPSI